MKERIISLLRESTFVSVVFLLIAGMLRIYEVFALSQKVDIGNTFASGFSWNLCAAASFITVVVIVLSPLLYLTPRLGYACLVAIGCVYVIGSFGLIQYFSITLLPLGADIFGYSWNDIKTTVSSSEGFSGASSLSLVFYVGIFIALCYFPKKEKLINKTPLSACGLVMTTLLFLSLAGFRPKNNSYKDDLSYYLEANKTDIFFQRAIHHFKGQNTVGYAGYPFLQPIKTDSTLNAYFNLTSTPPNIVFILVEGLGRDFTGKGASFGGFTPFLDSLAKESLYWNNALSNAGRTFGVLPSILGSLPYGKNGFMGYGAAMPSHHSIISLLKEDGYTSNFFYGGNSNFDNQDIFLENQGIDFILDETKFPSPYSKMTANSAGFSWGYADRDVFNYSLEILASQKKTPRLDVYLTLSTHEPFKVPEPKFTTKFDTMLNKIEPAKHKQYTTYRNIFECLLYTDDALKEFFSKISARADYSNTIFILTGDHRLIPVPAANKLSRFHVPMLIFSPMLKKAKTFDNIITHADVTPGLLNLLHHQFNIKLPDSVAFISSSNLVSDNFSSDLDLALIRNKNETLDYIEGKYMLSENRLFEITSTLELEPIQDDTKLQQLSKKLTEFVGKGQFACEKNQLIKDSKGKKSNIFLFTAAEEKYIDEIQASNLTPDSLYRKARSLAFERKYFESRILARYVLNNSPNYHDARILLARTFAWDGNYDTARFFLKQVLQRSPQFEDAMAASIDVEYWSGNHENALLLSSSIVRENASAELTSRIARSLMMVGQTKEAEAMVKEILEIHPGHPLCLDLQAKLSL